MRTCKVGLIIVLGILLVSSLGFGSCKLNPIIDDSVSGQDLTLLEETFSYAVESLFPLSSPTPLPGREVVEIATARPTLDNLNIEHAISPGVRITFTVNQNLIDQGWAAPSLGSWETSSLVFELIAYPASDFDNFSFQERAEKSLANFQILQGLTVEDSVVVIDHERLPENKAPIKSLEKILKNKHISVYNTVQELSDAAKKNEVIIYIAHDPKACFGDANHSGPVFNALANVDLHGKMLIFLVCGSSDQTWERWFEAKQEELIYKRGAAAVISFNRLIDAEVVQRFMDALTQQSEAAILSAMTDALSKIATTGNDFKSADFIHAIEITTGLAWTTQYD